MPMRAKFVEPMLLLRTENLPEGPDWSVELKLDGYRALAIKTGGKVQLRSRNDNDFSLRYPAKCSLRPKDWNACFFSATIRNFDGDEPPIFEDACPVFCPKVHFRVCISD